MNEHAKVLHGRDWAASPNGKPTQGSLQQSVQGFWERLFKPEDLIVAGREVKGIVLTPTMVLTIVLAIIGAAGGVYWKINDSMKERIDALQKSNDANHDLLIRLDQRNLDDKKSSEADAERIEKRFQNIDAVQTVLGRDLAALKAKGQRN